MDMLIYMTQNSKPTKRIRIITKKTHNKLKYFDIFIIALKYDFDVTYFL